MKRTHTLLFVTGLAGLAGCNGATSPADTCPLQVEAGVGEVPASCDCVCGTVELDVATDVEAAEFCECLTGDLHITSAALSLISLPKLTYVRGDVLVANNVDLLSVDLPALTRADGVEIVDNPSLQVVGLSSLEVTLSLRAVDNPSLTELEAPISNALESVEVVDNEGMERLALPEPFESEVVWVQDLPALTELELGVGTVGERLELFELPEMTSLDGLAQLERVDGLLWVERTGILHTDGLGNLVHVGEGIELRDNADLARVRAPSIASLGELAIESNPALTELDLPALEAVDALILFDNDALTTVPSLPSLETLGRLEVVGHANLEDLAGLSEVARYGPIRIENNHALTSVAVLDGRPATGHISIVDNDALTLVTLPSAGGEAASVTVAGNDALTRITAPSTLIQLNTTTSGGPLPFASGGTFEVDDNPALTEIDAPGLVRTARSVTLTGLPALDTLSMPVLEEIGQTLTVDGTGLDTLAGLDALQIAAEVVVTDNPCLAQSDVDAFLAGLTVDSATSTNNGGSCP